jgi:hypothetical protein
MRLKFLCVGIAVWCGLRASVALGASVDFARDVRPVLEQRCFECHGEKKQKNGLRLDRKAGFFTATDSGKPVVVPGKSVESSLLARLTTEKEDEVMPPKGRKLSAAEAAGGASVLGVEGALELVVHFLGFDDGADAAEEGEVAEIDLGGLGGGAEARVSRGSLTVPWPM